MVDVAIKSTDGHPLAFLPQHDGYTDDHLRRILRRVKTFAMVGASTQWRRPSFYAMKYLTKKGYRVIPINPGRAGRRSWTRPFMVVLRNVPISSTWWIFFAPRRRRWISPRT